jgi:hypothetical protein
MKRILSGLVAATLIIAPATVAAAARHKHMPMKPKIASSGIALVFKNSSGPAVTVAANGDVRFGKHMSFAQAVALAAASLRFDCTAIAHLNPMLRATHAYDIGESGIRVESNGSVIYTKTVAPTTHTFFDAVAKQSACR